MTDAVELRVDGRKIANFQSYMVEADLYTADHAFSLELANPETPVNPGSRCQLYVNGELELTGLVDRRPRRYTKTDNSLCVEGRDLMGLLVDSHCEQFVTVQGKKLSELARMLLKSVPFIDRANIVYQDDLVGRLKTRKHRGAADSIMALMDSGQRLAQIEPGMTVFDVLRMYAASRGLMFFSLPDGTFVFGRPKSGGEPAYTITSRRDGIGNNVLEGEETPDISKRYSKVTVLGQQQGQDDMGMDATRIAVQGSVTDRDFPFYKPFVQRSNNDSQSPAQHARLLLERMRHDGYQLAYRVAGHSQNGRNWRVNELCRVRDEIFGVDATFLIYQRRFERSKQGGSTTYLRLGPPGLVSTEKLGGRI
jgi:prophage tail gpP-like protein